MGNTMRLQALTLQSNANCGQMENNLYRRSREYGSRVATSNCKVVGQVVAIKNQQIKTCDLNPSNSKH